LVSEMLEQSGRREADKKLIVVILVLGPIVSYTLWMMLGGYMRAGIVVYIFVSITMILLFVYWAWMGKPPWPFF
jgi:hypothetical protein